MKYIKKFEKGHNYNYKRGKSEVCGCYARLRLQKKLKLIFGIMLYKQMFHMVPSLLSTPYFKHLEDFVKGVVQIQ